MPPFKIDLNFNDFLPAECSHNVEQRPEVLAGIFNHLLVVEQDSNILHFLSVSAHETADGILWDLSSLSVSGKCEGIILGFVFLHQFLFLRGQFNPCRGQERHSFVTA